jgi:hypothetical protein
MSKQAERIAQMRQMALISVSAGDVARDLASQQRYRFDLTSSASLCQHSA